MTTNLSAVPAGRLSAVTASRGLAARSGSAIAVAARLPIRRPAKALLASTTAGVASGVAGTVVYAANGSDLGRWLLVGAGVAAVVALNQAADRARRLP